MSAGPPAATLLTVCFCVAVAMAADDRTVVTADSQRDFFPFAVSRQVEAGGSGATDVSSWLPQEIAGSSGFVRVTPEGRLATDAGLIRFWGTNTVYEACFPESREKAERVAARLARLGINCVRLHHMDSGSIWEGSPNKTILSPEKLRRLDDFIYCLKQHGIYVDINLHVSREFGAEEGFGPEAAHLPKFGKGINQFEPRMIELQKKYARDLLTHVNTYTGLAYTDEPAVAFIEINNENSLLNRWRYGTLDNLPGPYAATFGDLWNDWLRAKYGTTEALHEAWDVGSASLGAETLGDTEFRAAAARGQTAWRLQLDETMRATDEMTHGGPDGQPARRITIRDVGHGSFLPQLLHADLAVTRGQTYTLSFRLRSDEPGAVTVNCMMNHAPWGKLGLDVKLDTDASWRRHTLTFIAGRDDEQARITAIMPAPGVYEFADVSLRPGGVAGPGPEQRLEDRSVALVRRTDYRVTPRQLHDFVDFVYAAEQDYWDGMYGYIRNDLKAQAIVSGTQLSASPVFIQSRLDYIDSHEYWHHPTFPEGRSWDKSSAWFVRNQALVNDPAGCVGRLASRRVIGMAYTVSEYDHPDPNQFTAEGFPILSAMAAFQDWAGVFSFAHSHDTDYEPDYMTGFFCFKASPHKLVHMPACVAMFRRGDVATAMSVIAAPITAEQERGLLHEVPDPTRLVTDSFGLDSRRALRHGIGLKLLEDVAETGGVPPLPEASENSVEGPRRFVSDTGQMVWDITRAGRGVFTVSSPRTRLFTGFADGRQFDLGGLKLSAIGCETGAATISAVCIDGADLTMPGRVLIAASGTARNTGAILEKLGADGVSLRKSWGKGPVLCEGITATVGLPVPPERLTAYALDGDGRRVAPVPVISGGGGASLMLSPRYRTLWYEVLVK